MTPSPRFARLIIGSSVLLLPTIGSSLADQAMVSIFSAGSTTSTNNSWLNAGQTAIGDARSRTHGMSAGGIPVLVELSTPNGDIDGDGDVDLDDHAIFTLCMSDPNVTLPPRGCTQEHFDIADVHTDGDVDMQDFWELRPLFTVTN